MKMGESSPNRQKTLGKGEIARSEQVLLFRQCFQKTCISDTYKPGLVWERVKVITKSKPSERACVITHGMFGSCQNDHSEFFLYKLGENVGNAGNQ